MTSPDFLIALAAADRIGLPGDWRHMIVPASTPIGQRGATLAHIAVVYRRARKLPCRETCGREALRVAALVHERTGPALHRAAQRLSSGRAAQAACRVVEHFGAIWKLSGAKDVASLVRQLGPHLRLYLLFELAHEGAAPPLFLEAWRAGGLGPAPIGRRFAGLQARLRPGKALHAPGRFVEAQPSRLGEHDDRHCRHHRPRDPG